MPGLFEFVTKGGLDSKRRRMFKEGAIDCGDLTDTEKKTWKVCGVTAPKKKPNDSPKEGNTKPKGSLFKAITGR